MQQAKSQIIKNSISLQRQVNIYQYILLFILTFLQLFRDLQSAGKIAHRNRKFFHLHMHAAQIIQLQQLEWCLKCVQLFGVKWGDPQG